MTNVPGAPGSGNPNSGLRAASIPPVLLAVFLALMMVAAESVVALAIVLMEGVVVLAVLTAAGLAGGWMVLALRMRREPLAARLIIGGALGIGALSLIVLGLGAAGLLTRVVAIALVAVLALAGMVRLALDVRERSRKADKPEGQDPPGKSGAKSKSRIGQPALPTSSGSQATDEIEDAGRTPQERGLSVSPSPDLSRFLWLAVAPFLAIALLAACLPPGVLWQEEGFGYDVLEYHLAVPKHFHEQGRAGFLPHNVYSNFPLNSSMLYLLMMTLHGDPIESAFMATLANVALAALFVAAAWFAGSTFSPASGAVAGVLAASAPWTAYLAGIAYVEPGMLAMGMCGLAVMLRALVSAGEGRGEIERLRDGEIERKEGGEHSEALKSFFLLRTGLSSGHFLCAGLLAGLACGYKYTAVPLIAMPLVILPLAGREPLRRRLRNVLLIAAGAGVTFAPWLLRNTINTGNPVFPLAWSVFGARPGAWDDVLEERWQRAHGSAAAEQIDAPFAVRAAQRTIGDERMGIALFVLAVIGAARGRDRWTLALALLLAWQAAVWLAFTHLFARFAVVMLLPLILLASRAAGGIKMARWRVGEMERESSGSPSSLPGSTSLSPSFMSGLVLALLLAGAGLNFYHLGSLYYHHTRIDGMPLQAYGRTDWFAGGDWPGTQHFGVINALPPESRVMLVGEARTFYLQPAAEYATVFDHHPLAGAVQRAGDEAEVLDWLRESGVTHVLAHWSEMERLRATYGFYAEITPGLFSRLMEEGLQETAVISHGGTATESERARPYATLYAVSHAEPRP